MTIPSKIKIGWKEYEVRKSSAVLNSGDDLYGQIDYNAKTITLCDANSSDQDECTLIHEVLHGISEMYGLGMEEDLVERLANALYTVMKDNKELIEKESREDRDVH